MPTRKSGLKHMRADKKKRARNARQSPPKNADRAEYHRATALEALIGYLYIMGREARMREVLNVAMGDFNEG